MKISITNWNTDDDSLECNVWVNGEKVNVESCEHVKTFECPANSNVQIEITNCIFESSKSWLLFILYWVLSLLSGSGEQSPFGKPVKSILVIDDTGKKDLYLEINELSKTEAFAISENCKVSQNAHTWPRKYKVKWFCAFALPSALLIAAIILLFALIDYDAKYAAIKWMLLVPSCIAGVAWCIYVVRMMKR